MILIKCFVAHSELDVQRELFLGAMKDLEGSVLDVKGPGFFDSVVKAPEGAERKKRALDAYARGKTALNEWIKIANVGLMRELNVIETM